jgi:chloride channel 3/4/5
LVSATVLRAQLKKLHEAGELDGGLPVIRNEALVGLIPAPDLEFALDHLQNEENSLCLMTKVMTLNDSDDEEEYSDPTDFTPYIDPVRPTSFAVKSQTNITGACCPRHTLANGPCL